MLGPFSRNGRYARPMSKGASKTFWVLPASSALVADYEKLYPTDEEGVKRVYSGNDCLADAITKVFVIPHRQPKRICILVSFGVFKNSAEW